MIPQEKSEAVARGLYEAFGVTEFEDILQLTGGNTPSLVFRIIVRGSSYLLKIITRVEDPTRHYNSMKAAAEAGLAPDVWYTDIEEKISITDFVPAVRLPVSRALLHLPATLRRLHALPSFARAPFNTTCTFLLNKGPALDGFLEKIQTVDILPHADREELFARYAQVAAVYPYDDAEMVSSHNDLFKPDNILFDGSRLWLVDWEAAFLNDRYADLAVVANMVVSSSEEEMIYLGEYFGAPPSQYQLARFHLMRQLAHMFYTMAFLLFRPSTAPIDWSEAAPDISTFRRRAWAGELNLAGESARLAYGRAHLAQFLEKSNQQRFNEALRIVADRHPSIRLAAEK